MRSMQLAFSRGINKGLQSITRGARLSMQSHRLCHESNEVKRVFGLTAASLLIVVGEINLGGSIEPIHSSVTIAEIAIEKGAASLL